jgi:hypothetical protein
MPDLLPLTFRVLMQGNCSLKIVMLFFLCTSLAITQRLYHIKYYNLSLYREQKVILIVKTIPGRNICASENLLLTVLHEILEHGGEGIILQKSDSPYHPGRSSVLYKMKVHLYSNMSTYRLCFLVLTNFKSVTNNN